MGFEARTGVFPIRRYAAEGDTPIFGRSGGCVPHMPPSRQALRGNDPRPVDPGARRCQSKTSQEHRRFGVGGLALLSPELIFDQESNLDHRSDYGFPTSFPEWQRPSFFQAQVEPQRSGERLPIGSTPRVRSDCFHGQVLETNRRRPMCAASTTSSRWCSLSVTSRRISSLNPWEA